MKHKLIGLYQLITGIFGVILLVFKFIQGIGSNNLVVMDLVGILLFAGVAYAGYGLLNRLTKAVHYSIWAQAFQIISFSYGRFIYMFTGSYFLSVVYNGRIDFEIVNKLISFKIGLINPGSSLEIQLFIVPILLLVLLVKK